MGGEVGTRIGQGVPPSIYKGIRKLNTGQQRIHVMILKNKYRSLDAAIKLWQYQITVRCNGRSHGNLDR